MCAFACAVLQCADFHGNRCVLVVDDHTVNLKILTKMLKGFQVYVLCFFFLCVTIVRAVHHGDEWSSGCRGGPLTCGNRSVGVCLKTRVPGSWLHCCILTGTVASSAAAVAASMPLVQETSGTRTQFGSSDPSMFFSFSWFDAHIVRNHADAILMDIAMPVLDGAQATRQIRNLETEHARFVTWIVVCGLMIALGDWQAIGRRNRKEPCALVPRSCGDRCCLYIRELSHHRGYRCVCSVFCCAISCVLCCQHRQWPKIGRGVLKLG